MPRLPITGPTGAVLVPEWVDHVSPAVAAARKVAANADAALRAARAAAVEARDAFYATAERDRDTSEWRPRGDVATSAYDAARLAHFKADAEHLSADRAARSARDRFHSIAAEEAATPVMAAFVEARWEEADAATTAAYAAFEAALAHRRVLDQIHGVHTLTSAGVYALTESTPHGERIIYRASADEHFGDAYTLRNAAAIARPALIGRGAAR